MKVSVLAVALTVGAGVYTADTTLTLSLDTAEYVSVTVPASTATDKPGLMTALADAMTSAGVKTVVSNDTLVHVFEGDGEGIVVDATVSNLDSVTPKLDTFALTSESDTPYATKHLALSAVAGAVAGYVARG